MYVCISEVLKFSLKSFVVPYNVNGLWKKTFANFAIKDNVATHFSGDEIFPGYGCQC